MNDCLFAYAKRFEIILEAWALFSNHHLIARVDHAPTALREMVESFHSLTSSEVNDMDGTPGRRVWYQFRDTHLSFEKSYLARLKYVHQDPVHHGLVRVASQYTWCSAGWFESHADRSLQRTLDSFKIDKVKVDDPFVPELDEQALSR